MADAGAGKTANWSRRRFLQKSCVITFGGVLTGPFGKAAAAETLTLPFANGERKLIAFPQKRPLILITTRPPQLETPFGVFNQGLLTPNDAFFVRYHLSQVPTSIDPKSFTLTVKGAVNTPLSL